MDILLATHNPAKFLRYKRLLKDFSYLNLLALKDLNIFKKVDEPYGTAKENAEHKAKEYAKMSGFPTLAIDEAATTNFLPENEQPGVYVRRFANKDKEMTDEESLVVWSEIFKMHALKPKKFIWDFSIAYFNPQNEQIHYCKAIMYATVSKYFSNKVEKGYPMSSFLILDGSSKPYVELSDEEKLKVDKRFFINFLHDFESWISMC